jgi:hypothetical protein
MSKKATTFITCSKTSNTLYRCKFVARLQISLSPKWIKSSGKMVLASPDLVLR